MTMYSSYSNFTVKGHGTIDTGGNGSEAGALIPYNSCKISSDFKLTKTVSSPFGATSQIRRLSTEQKAHLIASLRKKKQIKVAKNIALKYIKEGKIEVYTKPTKRKSKKNYIKSDKSVNEIYQHLLQINRTAAKKRRP